MRSRLLELSPYPHAIKESPLATRLSIIIPTLGRTTLQRAVNSALASMGPQDELLVVSDGYFRHARQVMLWTDDPRTRFIETAPSRSWGTMQYDVGMAMATGEWCVFLPDDDIMTPEACAAVRGGVHHMGVHVFACRMDHWGGRVLSRSKNCGEVTANQIVVPRETEVSWQRSDRQVFDWDYLNAVLAFWNQHEPYYHDDIICIADQANLGKVDA